MNTFKLIVLAADKPFYEGKCNSLVFSTIDGEHGVQANHCNMIAAIVPGTLRIVTPENGEEIAAVSEGIIKVENNTVLILVDTIERPEEIDENRAKRAMEESKEAILQKKSIKDYYSAQARLTRAVNRLKTKHYVNMNK
ncbi:MAG: ATP synthase F1 subunit epsilon [Clostridia bacterium]|jgi:F-type H+-transporting ATPase subunit epsilon|nr:ATP synthase F1 subunit epsilon [Clostridia bacterium]